MPFDDSCYNIDVQGLAKLMTKEKPKLLIVGWSEFLFPHPLAELRELCDMHGTRLMYDMSHVSGLMRQRTPISLPAPPVSPCTHPITEWSFSTMTHWSLAF
jgi:glycine/serine hydroxymethyltransferase